MPVVRCAPPRSPGPGTLDQMSRRTFAVRRSRCSAPRPRRLLDPDGAQTTPTGRPDRRPPAAAAPPAATALPSATVAPGPAAARRPAGHRPGRSRSAPASCSLSRGKDRPLPTTVWYPAVGTAGRAPARGSRPPTGPFPVVLFSHGLTAQPSDYSAMLTRWAAGRVRGGGAGLPVHVDGGAEVQPARRDQPARRRVARCSPTCWR